MKEYKIYQKYVILSCVSNLVSKFYHGFIKNFCIYLFVFFMPIILLIEIFLDNYGSIVGLILFSVLNVTIFLMFVTLWITLLVSLFIRSNNVAIISAFCIIIMIFQYTMSPIYWKLLNISKVLVNIEGYERDYRTFEGEENVIVKYWGGRGFVGTAAISNFLIIDHRDNNHKKKNDLLSEWRSNKSNEYSYYMNKSHCFATYKKLIDGYYLVTSRCCCPIKENNNDPV